MIARWEHFEHEADMGVRGYGESREQAFEQAALALTAVITDLATVHPELSVPIQCSAPDDEILFAEWLNALVFEMATRRMLFSSFRVVVTGTTLEGLAWGEHVEPTRHHPAVEVKGATYTALKVAPVDDGWMAQTVVDV